jgi:hypothetical protein
MIAVIAVVLACLLPSCASFKHLTVVTEDTFPQAYQCGKCHVEIYHEWSGSDHAMAYTNPHFKKATNDYSFEDCLSCHAPQPSRIDTPVTRNIDRDEGVSCVSCHLEEGKLSGPLDPTGLIAPHPINVNTEYYKNSTLCGTCHQGEYNEWKNAKDDNKQTCQDCHMPEVTRKVTQSTGGISNIIVAFEDQVTQKKHEFSTIGSTLEPDMISIEAKRNGGLAVLTIQNNLPHSLPAGDFGFRVLLLEAFAIDSKNNQTSIDQIELVKEIKSSIPALGTFIWQLKAFPETTFIRVKLSRLSYNEDGIICLTDIKVPLL